MRGKGFAGGCSGPGKDIQSARGKAGFLCQLAQAQPGQGSSHCQLQDDGVAAGQRRAGFLRHMYQRVVPRNDNATTPTAPYGCTRIGQGSRPFESRRRSWWECRRYGRSGPRLRGRQCAGCEPAACRYPRFQLGQLFMVGADEVTKPAEDGLPPCRRQPIPATAQRSLRGFYRAVHILWTGCIDVRQGRAVRRVVGCEGFPRERGDLCVPDDQSLGESVQKVRHIPMQ